MNCLVIGYGSIGQRHTRILEKLGCRVAVVSKRSHPFSYANLGEAINAQSPDYVIISNPTDQHYETLVELAGLDFKGSVLVEKPLFAQCEPLPCNSFAQAYVGYNLRFHPIIQKLYNYIHKEKPYFAQVYVGQYLPSWRLRDYRLSYSAHRSQGGGVLLDLSHELDYLLWLLGPWQRLTAHGGKFSSLEIDSPDIFSLMVAMEDCPMVQINLNYLDHIKRREITMLTDSFSIKADLVRNCLQVNDESWEYELDIDFTYELQHKAVLKGASDILCTFPQGLQVLELISAAEQSVSKGDWIQA